MALDEAAQPRQESAPLAAGRSVFPEFPHQPYPIQLDFMRALYDCLDAGGVGLFESPTGTVCLCSGGVQSCVCSNRPRP